MENKLMKFPNEKLHSYTTVRSDIQSIVPHTAMRILDAGCSNGTLGNGLKKLVPGRTVYGIEIDDALCQEATNKLASVYRGDLNIFDWHQLSEVSPFDCIIMADILEHLVNPLIAKLDRILRKDI